MKRKILENSKHCLIVLTLNTYFVIRFTRQLHDNIFNDRNFNLCIFFQYQILSSIIRGVLKEIIYFCVKLFYSWISRKSKKSYLFLSFYYFFRIIILISGLHCLLYHLFTPFLCLFDERILPILRENLFTKHLVGIY